MLNIRKHPFDVKIKAGESWAIIGENGAGKSTLINELCGITPSHNITYKNEAVSKLKNRAQQLGLLPQLVDYTMPIRVIDAIANGRYPYRPDKQKDNAAIESAMQTMGLSHLKNRFAHTLSGGEQQRVAIATLLTQDPDIFFLDEPTNHLDLNYQLIILKHFKNLTEQGKSVIICSHDTRLLHKFVDHCLILFNNGTHRVVNADALTNKKLLKEIYGLPEESLELL